MARTVSVVPHTHWDREWYRSFPAFRMRLVDLLDELLPQLEADPSYAHFMLDGQMAVVDDYLAVRPEAEARLRRLALSGRVGVGPWYILMDEFLVSGETIIRNLQRGLDRAGSFGGAMEVGYLPDMFGHIAQMPQLLAQFGFDHAVVWRGVPQAVGGSAFWWEAPDGSQVRAEYLPGGYGNGAAVPDDAKALLARIAEFDTDHDLLDGPVLWMNGTDHLMPQPWLGRVVAEANAISDEWHLEVRPLADHLADAPTGSLAHWRGELRSGARANLLMGVASNRVDVKVAAARAERALERLAEPLSALFLPAGAWPATLLDEAWLHVIRNSAHDSICACSVDEVGAAVLHRFSEAADIGAGLTHRALRALGATLGGDAPVAVNPSARDRSGLVTVDLPGEGPVPGGQVLEERPARRLVHRVTRVEAPAVVLREVEMDPRIHAVEIDDPGEGTVAVVLRGDAVVPGQMLTGELRRSLRALAASDRDDQVEIHHIGLPRRRALVRATDVPGFGWAACTGDSVDVQPVTADGTTLANGVIYVEVDTTDGTFAIDGHGELGRLVDDGDEGDTYNWSPPAVDTIVDRPESVTVTATERGPLRASLRIDASYRWPERIDADSHARVGSREVQVATTLELHAGDDLLRITVDLDNVCRDHRLRGWFPLPEPARSSHAECAFAVVERGLDAEGGPTERALPTYPSRRFVRAGGLTVAHEGLLEYELVDLRGEGDDRRAGALALTLLRATGWLSRGPMTNRPLPAGPVIATEDAQVQGRHRLRYAVHIGDRDPYAVVDDAFLPLQVARPAGGHGPDHGQALNVTGAEVSALTRAGDRLELRVFNPTAEPTTVTIAGRAGWLVDLRGRPVEPFEESFELAAWRIATCTLRE
ncbi:hypothetical protein BH20ACT2_BH20ACT2_23740 [soil metagenome]